MHINTAVGEIRTHYLNLPKDDLTEGGRFTAEVLEKLVATEREKVLCGIDNIDIGILKILLDEHIGTGSYWGRKDHHYKRCIEIRAKLNQLKEDK